MSDVLPGLRGCQGWNCTWPFRWKGGKIVVVFHYISSFCPKKLLWKQLVQLIYEHLSPTLLLWPFNHPSRSNCEKIKNTPNKKPKAKQKKAHVINRCFLSSAFRGTFLPCKSVCLFYRLQIWWQQQNRNVKAVDTWQLWAQCQAGTVLQHFAPVSKKAFTCGKGHPGVSIQSYYWLGKVTDTCQDRHWREIMNMKRLKKKETKIQLWKASGRFGQKWMH